MPPLTDPARGPVPAQRSGKNPYTQQTHHNHYCYSKHAVANRRHQVPASLRISGLAAAVALTAALTSCSTGGGSPSSSPASASTLKQQAQREHGLVIYANIPSQYFQPIIAAFNKQYPFIRISTA